MKFIFSIFFLSICISSFSQVKFEWQSLWSKPLTQSIFAIDNYNNLYLADQQTIYKIDSTGKQLFQQSVKEWGGITSIDARNPMKILLFSESQQLAIYLDNTMTRQQAAVDLSDQGFSYVTALITSSQPDKVWLFDSDNSRIVLYSSMKIQEQRIDNIYGLLGIRNLTQMLEYNNQLFLLDPSQGIFILDRFGTLIDMIKIPDIHYFELDNNILYYLSNGKLLFVNLLDKLPVEINLPIQDVEKFYKHGDRFYFQTKNGIEVFRFKIPS